MPALEDHDLRETALLWRPTGVDSFGQRVYNDGYMEIDVRWLDSQGEMLTKDNISTLLMGQAVVDVDVPVGSLLWYGTELEWASGTGSGTGSSEGSGGKPELVEVKSVDNTPDLKARNYRRTVSWLRYKGVIPTS